MRVNNVNTTLLLNGLLLGLSIAAPVGPIGLLCIRRTLAHGRVVGFVSGLGAATADAIYGVVAGFGLVAISSFLLDQRFWLELVGGLFLLGFGISTALAQPATTVATTNKRGGLLAAYFSTLALTLSNPVTILSFVAIFAGLRLTQVRGYEAGVVLFVLGVFLGSALWWLFLCGITSLARERLNSRMLQAINVFSGLILIGFGLFSLWNIVRT